MPTGAGYQVVQALYAFARGGVLGTGLGAGLPAVEGRLPIPAVHTDFPLAALGEELGLIGITRCSGCTSSSSSAACGSRPRPPTSFARSSPPVSSLVVGMQAFIIAAGNLKLIPLTGITLPFISYGGSSLLVNAIIVGLLLALSDRGVEPPPPPQPPRGRLCRLPRSPAESRVTGRRRSPNGGPDARDDAHRAHPGSRRNISRRRPSGWR